MMIVDIDYDCGLDFYKFDELIDSAVKIQK